MKVLHECLDNDSPHLICKHCGAVGRCDKAAPSELERECNDTDAILRALGFDPDNARTEGGSLKLLMVLESIGHRDVMLKRTVKLMERDRCAAICDGIARQYKDDSHGHAAERAANAIRLDQP